MSKNGNSRPHHSHLMPSEPLRIGWAGHFGHKTLRHHKIGAEV